LNSVTSVLSEFISDNREEILTRAGMRVRRRSALGATEPELSLGLPLFLDQLGAALRRLASRQGTDQTDIDRTAIDHGKALFHQGMTVAQVVHDYGDLCQVTTELVLEQNVAISTDEFKMLNLCLDDAIASAVTEFSRLRERAIASEGLERLGYLAHEMRNVLNALMLSFASIKQGFVTPNGSTGEVHSRNLTKLQTLIDRSLADVRLDAGMQNVERVAVCEALEEVEIGANATALARGVHLSVVTVDANVIVDADRQILVATIANLLQNAFKFTRKDSNVLLKASVTATRVLIEVEDECGGLPPGRAEDLFRPFEQKGVDRTGLGLGLAICLKAVRAMSGELRVHDLPGKGCRFTIDLPKQPPPPTPIRSREGKGQRGSGSPPGTSARPM
jgi:signal transduction histidine kinase